MSKKRKNAGEGYGYMFSGAFAKKADAAKKEKTRKGSFVKSIYVQGQHRYAVMTPRTNPIKRKKKPAKNPHELLVMAANPHEIQPAGDGSKEIMVPPGSTITIRMNPELRTNAFAPAYARQMIEERARKRADAAYERQQKARAKAARADEDRADKYYGSLRKSARKGPRKVRDLFHELYSPLEENPLCGARIGGELCTRKPGHRGPHLPQGATMRTAKRLPHSWKPKKNPSAAGIREDFTGAPADWFTVENEPHMPAGDYAQLGELLALYVKPGRGTEVQQINFKKSERPILVSDESARQLWFVGGGQDLSSSLSAFGAEGAGLVELGELRRIDYKQRKEHVPHPDHDEWRHELGEESGVRPILLFDTRHKRILLRGGEYEVRPEGIVN